MIKIIKKCRACNLYINQEPLIDRYKKSDLMWIGISAKKVSNTEEESPLSINTNTGSIIAKIESSLDNISTYKSNIVKCVPLDDKDKLRYPTKDEMNICFENLLTEIKYVNPKIVFLLGDKVTNVIEKKLNIKFPKRDGYNCNIIEKNNIYYISVYHPSYIYSYRRKEEKMYIDKIVNKIKDLLKR